jgi:hypothetical protein
MEKLAELAHKYRMSKARLDVIPAEMEAIDSGEANVDLDSWFADGGNMALVKERSAKTSELVTEKAMLEHNILPALKIEIEKELLRVKESNLAVVEAERKALESELATQQRALDLLLDQVLGVGLDIYGTRAVDRVNEKFKQKVSKYLQSNRKEVEMDMGILYRSDHFDVQLSKAVNSNEILKAYFDEATLASFANTQIKPKIEDKAKVVAEGEVEELAPVKVDPFFDPEYAETVQSGMTELMNE